METKADIRKQYRMRRDSLPAAQRRDLDRCIFERVVRNPAYIQAERIYTYVSIGSEVDTRALLTHAWTCGKKVAVPKVLTKEKMEFYYIESLEELKQGNRNIPEPEAKHPVGEEPALVIMPLVAFDKQYHRIGYGGGYYDRFLSKHPEHQTMALAYSMQETAFIPVERVDICPQRIVTEKYILQGEAE